MVVAKSEAKVKVLPFGKVAIRASYRMGEITAAKAERVVTLPELTLQTVWFTSPPRSPR